MTYIELVIILYLATAANSLFLNETFLYKGIPRKLGSSFNISLIPVGTIPMSLRLNSMCQVPSFQLQQFNIDTNGRFIAGSRRSDYQCSTVNYCDDGGDAGAYDDCTYGTQHQLADASCVANAYNTLQQAIAAANTQTLQAAMDNTQTVVDAAISGVGATFNSQLSGLQSILQGSIDQQANNTAQLVSSSCSAVLATANNNIQSLSSQTSSNMANLKQDINNQLQTASSQINSLAATLAYTNQQQSIALAAATTDLSNTIAQVVANSQSNLVSVSNQLQSNIVALKGVLQSNTLTLQGNINNLATATTANINYIRTAVNSLSSSSVSLTIALNSKVDSLSAHVTNAIDVINSNYLLQQDNYASILQVTQQLGIAMERVSRFQDEGVDISVLLSQWRQLDKSNVFVDQTNNSYNYVATGMAGLYDTSSPDVSYSSTTDIVGSTVYRCYEKGSVPVVPNLGASITVDVSMSYYLQMTFGDYVNLCVADGLGCLANITQYLLNTNSYCVASTYLQLDIGGEYYGNGCQDASVATDFGYWQPGSVCIVRSQCINQTMPVPSSYSAPVSDGRFVNIIDNTGVLARVTPDTYDFSIMYTNVLEYLASTHFISGQLHTIPIVSSVIDSVIYGNNHFILQHPTMGNMNIHRCVPIAGGPINPVYDYNSSVGIYSSTDNNGRLLNGGANGLLPAVKNIDTAGLLNGTARLLVPQTDATGEPIPNLVPDMYYYSSDIWCCDPVTITPINTVDFEYQCSNISLAVCPKVLFGNCSIGYTIQERILLRLGINYVCPTGYVTTPSSKLYKYKSPRTYFCSATRRYAEPYGATLTFCLGGNIPLPGAGVNIATGVMAPAGLYPASCIYYNTVNGTVPLYSISATFEDEIVPTLLSTLNNRRLAYYYGEGIVVDEMDRLYGIGNSGYDCVMYEMNKILHDPKSCVNFDIPTYDMVSYFSGKIRSTGVSSLLDYFTITPVYTSGQLQLNFALLDGIDYESAIISNADTCPVLEVSYASDSTGKTCILSGWPTVSQQNKIISVAGVNVCNGGASCVTSLKVTDGSYVTISVTVNGSTSSCNKFQCLASENAFLAYPVDVFNLEITRPQLAEFIGGDTSNNYTQQIVDAVTQANGVYKQLLNQVTANISQQYDQVVLQAITVATHTYNSSLSQIIQTLNKNIASALSNLTQSDLYVGTNTTIVIQLKDVDLTTELAIYKNATDSTVQQVAAGIGALKIALQQQIDNITAVVANITESDYKVAIARLEALIGTYNHSASNDVSSSNGGQGGFGNFQIGSIGGSAITGNLVMYLAIAALAVGGVSLMGVIFILKTMLMGGSKVTLASRM